jgi:hypothetical protein
VWVAAELSVAIDRARIGRCWSLTAAATIGSHSNPGWRVMVVKSFIPKIETTPPAANTAAANR